jgi:hypothetical protein
MLVRAFATVRTSQAIVADAEVAKAAGIGGRENRRSWE